MPFTHKNPNRTVIVRGGKPTNCSKLPASISINDEGTCVQVPLLSGDRVFWTVSEDEVLLSDSASRLASITNADLDLERIVMDLLPSLPDSLRGDKSPWRNIHSKLREQLTAWICRCQLYLINRYRSSLGNGVPWLAYDIMNGICGNLRILLDENSTNARETINLSVKYLCDLVLTSNSQGMPGWWVPGNLQPTKQDENEYPDGDLNVGVAHGAAGILGTLVSVFNYGYTDTRVMDSIKRIMEWTFHWTQHADDFDYWPARIPTNCQIQDDVLSPLPTRAGWCYGTPGIAVEMLRASTLLDDVDTTGHIIDILSSHLSSPTNQWHIAGPTFCHGYAGVLYSVFKAWTLCGSEVLRNIGSNMANNLLAMADECSPFVYQHWMYSNTPSHKINLKKLDNVGLLEGSSGIGLVLYSICNQGDSSANWDRVFALS